MSVHIMNRYYKEALSHSNLTTYAIAQNCIIDALFKQLMTKRNVINDLVYIFYILIFRWWDESSKSFKVQLHGTKEF